MRLSFFFAPMTAFLVQTVGFAASSIPAVSCPSSNAYEMDAGHFKFELPEDFDYQTIVRVANEMVSESSDPEIQEIEVRQFLHYAYRDLPILVHFTGKYKTFNHHPEKELEFVVLRPIKDCFLTEDVSPKNTDQTFVYSRAFEKDEFNVAVVRRLIENNVVIQPISSRARAWLCAVNPKTPECALLLP